MMWEHSAAPAGLSGETILQPCRASKGQDMQDDDDTRPLTEAERISQTRFGARPIPKGHRRAKTADEDYRRIPPHGDVSPDGQRIWPQPSAAAKLLVWGGTAAAAVAVTAGTALVLRRVTDALSGDTSKPRPKPARARPTRHGFADVGPESRRPQQSRRDNTDDDRPVQERAHREARPETARPETGGSKGDRFEDAQFRNHRRDDRMRDAQDVARGASYPREARHPLNQDEEFRPRRRPRRRKPRNLIAEFEDNSRRMTQSVDGVFGSLGTAVTGFLSVARQAGTIMREFGDAADLVRAVMDSARKPAPEEPRTASDADKDRRTHNL